MILAGCAISPEKLCASLVPGTLQYIGPDAGLSASLETSLPQAPYTTNEGKLVRDVQHVWYRGRGLPTYGMHACEERTEHLFSQNHRLLSYRRYVVQAH